MNVNKLLLKMCGPVDGKDLNLRVNPERSAELLSDPRFKGVDTEDLISLASGRVKGVTDRCTAIAVLRGVK
jgi:hypothetical protein